MACHGHQACSSASGRLRFACSPCTNSCARLAEARGRQSGAGADAGTDAECCCCWAAIAQRASSCHVRRASSELWCCRREQVNAGSRAVGLQYAPGRRSATHESSTRSPARGAPMSAFPCSPSSHVKRTRSFVRQVSFYTTPKADDERRQMSRFHRTQNLKKTTRYLISRLALSCIALKRVTHS